MSELFTAIGLVLVFEGLIYGGFPRFAKRMAQDTAQAPESFLRVAGITLLAVGVGIVWLIRG